MTMSHPSLRLAAARFVLELASTEELIDAAHDALNDSIYSYSLGELATLREPRMAEAARLFRAAMNELEMTPPTMADAIDVILCNRYSRLAEGMADPVSGTWEIVRICDSFQRQLKKQRVVSLEDLDEA